MAKVVDDTVLDGALNIIKNGAVFMTVTPTQPVSAAAITGTAILAQSAMTSTDFTIANGDTSGRKVTVAAKSGLNIPNSNTATHVSLHSGSVLHYVTTCTSQALTSGNTVNIPTWKIEIADPT